MLRAAIACPDAELAKRLHALLVEISGVVIVKSVGDYPLGEDLGRLMRMHVPEVIFVSVERLESASELVNTATSLLDGVQFIAVGRHADPSALLQLMRLGVREFLSHPFEERPLIEALVRVKDILDRKPVKADSTDRVYGFLPAKPGCGTTTIAVNAAVAASRIADSPSLLIDSDRVSGMVRFLLQLDNEYSLHDALERALHLDENLWPQLVAKFGPLDVIHSGTLRTGEEPDEGSTKHLLDFARRNYGNIFIDFPGIFDKRELEALHECKKIFLVVTPEVPSLHLGKERITFLGKQGMKDRVEVLLNRHPKRPVLQLESVSEILGMPVHMAFGNYYQEVTRALTSGRPVEPNSELGGEYTRFARSVLDKRVAQMQPQKKKTGNLLSLLPGSLSMLTAAKKPAN
ncbi:MAG: hypothetical protein JNK48_19010 [Bryobacterales bacterium]|nr:hypothetical protein [Bryobacterales bacterium]